MQIGTKSVLFGAHQFLIHPWFVAWGWWKLYGFPLDPRLWIAFFIHDLGYIGKPNMDGAEGERHPEFAANIMRKLFGDYWGDLCLYHSRFLAKRDKKHYSELCPADKLAIALTPHWLYLPMVKATGEIHEYVKLADVRVAQGEAKYASMNLATNDFQRWYFSVQEYCKRWAYEHADQKDDNWTPEMPPHNQE